MHYQIWIPEGQTLESVGLADHAYQGEKMPSPGPDGGQGVLITWRKNSPLDFGYFPERQKWIPAAECDDLQRGRYWVGLWNNKPPTTKNLIRDYPYAGNTMTLGGQDWIIPAAVDLPQIVKVADDGTLRFVVQRQFDQFYRDAKEMKARVVADGTITFADCWRFAIDALRINYRMTGEVASELELFDTDSLRLLAMNVIGGL